MASTAKTKKPWPTTELAAAVALGIDRTTLQKYLAKGAPKRTSRGFDVVKLQKWRDENISPTFRNIEPDDDEDEDDEEALTDRKRFLRAQAKEREAKAEKAVLDVQIQRGEFLPMVEVKERDLARIAVVKRGLLTLPRTAAPQLVGLKEKEMVAVLTKLVRELLERFAKM